MKELIEPVCYLLREHKERSIIIGLLILQVLLLIPLFINVFSEKIDFERMEKEALSSEKDGENTTHLEDAKTFSLRPFGHYWTQGRKDLFLRRRKVLSSAIGVVEQKRTAPLNYVGSYRTEKEVTAMIKNTKTGKSHFCKKGEKIDNFKIVDIKRDVLVVRAPSGEFIYLLKGSKEEVPY